ncbi:neuronal acetylcholine receptor subunit alpha-9 [Orussus abietinus]|uniref:neuronal acetylcholine receptor subunit alpha-9 n=1 Tax=Orussus abietinus TaxID=222816 RepID=UPI0006255DB2|nr:neuronal acetylcholine receptor subunit alpha-9 [Orussus abietinus]
MSLLFLVVFRLEVLPILFDLGRVFCDEHEYRLTKHLLEDYDAGVRPAENSSRPLTVVFGLSLHHIIDVDEKNQILTTNCWVTQVWTDHHLKWNTSEFAGIRVIRVPYNRVWRPDTILYNNADPQYSSSVINTNVIVSYTGQVVWLSHGIFRSSCDIDVEFFPFDEQRCELKWASWTYDGYQLELEKQSEQGDITNYQANGEFDLVDFSASKHVEFYSCCPEPYPDITYEIRLRRRPMFYVFNLILPCILINGIALLVFYVPSESGEKVTLGISALLSMTVFLMTIRETLPPTEKTPLISLYYGVSICLVSFASGLAVVTLNLHHRGVRGTRVPRIIRSLVLDKLAKVLFFDLQEDVAEPPKRTNTCPVHRKVDWAHQQQQISPKYENRRHGSSGSPSLEFLKETSLETHWSRALGRVHGTIERNERRLVEQDRRDRTELEWKQVALAHERQRRAEALIREGRFREAAECHECVANLLTEARSRVEGNLGGLHSAATSTGETLLFTSSIRLLVTLESLTHQRDYHRKQAAILRMKETQYEDFKATLESQQRDILSKQGSKPVEKGNSCERLYDKAEGSLRQAIYNTIEEHDSLLSLILPSPDDSQAFKHPKDTTVVIEELRTVNCQLRSLVERLLTDLEKKEEEVKHLTERLRHVSVDSSDTINSEHAHSLHLDPLPPLVPLEMPLFDFAST